MLYLESFGNPRRFARTARRLSARLPVLVAFAGQAPRQRAAASHTVAAAARPITPGRRCSTRPASSPPPASASCSTRPCCWRPSPSRPAAPSLSCPTAGGGRADRRRVREAGLAGAAMSPRARSRLREVLPVSSALSLLRARWAGSRRPVAEPGSDSGDFDQAVVLGDTLAAGRRARLQLPAPGADGQVRDERVLGFP